MRRKFLLVLFLLYGVATANTPQRIVSVAPGFTEVLYALGMDKEIVGTTNYCDYPPAAKQTAKIGDLLNPNVEKIISLHPDLVFLGAWKWQVPEKLRSVGIPVVEIKDAKNVQDILDRILLIGEKVGKQKEAKLIVAKMQTQLQKFHLRREALKFRPKVFVELDTGNWTVGGGSYLNEILEIAGLQNIFGDRKEPYLMVTTESIAARDPDLILSLNRTRDEYLTSGDWQGFRAVRNAKILDKQSFDWNAITRQSPRLIEGIRDLIAATNKLINAGGAGVPALRSDGRRW